MLVGSKKDMKAYSPEIGFSFDPSLKLSGNTFKARIIFGFKFSHPYMVVVNAY